MVSEELMKKKASVVIIGNTRYMHMPLEWLELIGFIDKDGNPVDDGTVALNKGKHGYFATCYNSQHQKK